MIRRRIVLATLFVSICVILSGIGHQSDANITSTRNRTTVRASVYPTGFNVVSSSSEEIRLHVGIQALRVQALGGGTSRLALDDGEPLSMDGAPDLPVYRRLVAVADGGDVTVAARVSNSTVLDDVAVRIYRNSSSHDSEHSQRSLRRSVAQPLALRTKFPKTIASVEYVGYLRGQRIASILVCPVQWDASSREVTIATDMEVVITVSRPSGSVLNNVGPMDGSLTGTVLNWSATGLGRPNAYLPTGRRKVISSGGQVCWCTGSTWQDVAGSAASCGADYLMIVTDSLATSTLIDTLALRRASYNGFNVAIAKISQLDSSPDTSSTPIAMRAMIDSVYSSQTAAHMSDGRLGYVLLVGDAFDSDRHVLVPSYYGFGSGPSFNAASDAFYSFLDGDPAEDRLPDIFIGRLPVDDDPANWELTNVVSKILAYEPLPVSAWVDSVLMVSGVNDANFTFDGLSGFQSFFDSTLAHYKPPGKLVVQLHRLVMPPTEGYHTAFGELVATRVETGKWMTAFFDHGNLYYWQGAFYPRNYEFLENENEPTIVLSLGSHTCQFDNTTETAQAWFSPPACCTAPPPTGIACESPGYQYIDQCDVMGERLLVQPGGAIAVIGYSRTTAGSDAQADFVNLFRSVSQQNPGTLGELLVGARLFRLSNSVTARNLMLLGDPALNVRTQAPAAPDTFDVAVGALDIRSPWSTYMRASSSQIDVAVHNTWKTDVYDLEVELWRGEPGGEESELLGTEVIDTLRAYGPKDVTFTVSGLEGNVRLFVALDPDDVLTERAEDNNIASRDFLAFRYEGDYPTHISLFPRRSLTIADLTTTPGKEVLVAGLNDNVLECYEMGDTNATWTYSTGSPAAFLKSQPVVGHVYKSGSSYVAVEGGSPSSVRILSGQNGSVVKTRAIGDTRSPGGSSEAKLVLTDLGGDDSAMELLTLRYVVGIVDTLRIRAFSPNGTALFSRLIGVANDAQPAAIAAGDIDRNGSKEIVTLEGQSSIDAPASGNELTVFSYGTGLTRKWQADLADGGSIASPSVALVDTDGDGNLSILCNAAVPGPALRLYDADSTLVWTRSDFTTGDSQHSAIYFAAGDVDGDGSAEVVVADHERVRILASSDAAVIETRDMVGDPVTPPLLADLDDDGMLEIITLFEKQDPHEHFVPRVWFTYITVLDENLETAQPGWTLRTTVSNGSACMPAIDDIDYDGRFEMAYVSPDQYLHVFELGPAAGDAAWPQRFANPLNTSLNEQPILGSGYTNAVSLYQRTRMLGHVTLDSIAAPSLYVGHGMEVRVDTSTADPYQLRAFGSVRMKGSVAQPIVFRSEPAASGGATWGGLYVDDRFASDVHPDTLINLVISDTENAISGRSPLFVKAVTIPFAFDNGIDLAAAGRVTLDGLSIAGAYNGINARDGTSVVLANATIDACENYGVSISDNSVIEATNSSFDGNVFATVLTKATGSWVGARIRDCNFSSNVHGIWISDTGDSMVVVEDCTIENGSTTGMYVEAANLTVENTTVRGAQLGINAHSGTTLSVSGSIVEDASLYGMLVRNSTFTMTGTSFDGNDTGLALSDGGGPWVKAVVRDCSFVNNGDGVWIVDIGDSSVVVDDCVIDDNTTSGIYIQDDGDITISRNEITNNTIGVYSYGGTPAIRSKNVIQYNTDGVKCDDFSTAVVESCTVNNNMHAIEVVNDANPDIGHATGGSSLGHNIMRPNDGYHVKNLTSNTIKAENNYLPKNPPVIDCNPSSTKFYGSVDRVPHLGCDEPDLSMRYDEPLMSGERPEPAIPQQFRLGQNFPNPFNPTTTIAYEVPKPGSRVEVVVFDVTGRRVAVLVNDHKDPGFYSLSWDGRNRNGESLASGVYFLRMRAGQFVDTKKLLLLK